jgi:serologically defined colon cancer antigen 8
MTAEDNWKFNVSKKIAVLTKVVFRLHSESLDCHDRIRLLKCRSDHELDELAQKTDDVIKSHLEAIEREKREYNESLMQQYRAEFATVRNTFEQKQTRFLEVIQSSEQQTELLKKEVDQLKAQFCVATRTFDCATKRIQTAHRKEIDELNANHEALTAASRQQQGGMAAKQHRAESDLKEQISSLKQTVADQTTEISNIRRSRKDLEDQLSHAKRQNAKLEHDIAELRDRRDCSDELKQARAELERIQQSFCQALRNHEIETRHLRSEIDVRQTAFDTKKAELNKKESEILAIQSEIDKLNQVHAKAIELKDLVIADQSLKHSVAIQEKADELDALKKAAPEKDAKISELETALRSEIQRNRENVDRLTSEISELRQKLGESRPNGQFEAALAELGQAEALFRSRLEEMNLVHREELDQKELELMRAVGTLRQLEDERNKLIERVRALEAELAPRRAAADPKGPPNAASASTGDLDMSNPLERRFRKDLGRPPGWNLPPLAEDDPKAARCPTARRKKRIRIDS